MKNVYSQSEISSATSDGGGGESSISYILETGALWKDKIKHAKIIFYLPNASGYEEDNTYSLFYLGGYQPPIPSGIHKLFFKSSIRCSRTYKNHDSLVCEWDFNNFEPTENIYVSWGSEPASMYVNSKDLMCDIEGDDTISSSLRKNKEEFFNEMQNEKVFYSYIIVLAESKLCIHNVEEINQEMDELVKEKIEIFKNEMEGVVPRFLINSLYALKGYKFSKPEWSKFYKQFAWYKPVTDKPEFSQKEKDWIAKLTKLGKETTK